MTGPEALRPRDPCQEAYIGQVYGLRVSVQLCLEPQRKQKEPFGASPLLVSPLLSLIIHQPQRGTSLKGRPSLDPPGHAPQAEAQPYEATKVGLAAATATASVTGNAAAARGRTDWVGISLPHPLTESTNQPQTVAAVAAPLCSKSADWLGHSLKPWLPPEVQLSRALTLEA